MRYFSKTLFMSLLVGSSLMMPAQAEEKAGNLSFSIAGEYSSGDYGTGSTTSIWYFPATVSYEMERLLFEVTIPYLVVQGTGEVLVSVDRHHVVQTQVSTARKTESGIGDVLFAGTYTVLPEEKNRPMVDVTGKFKVPTADEENNLGTGESDLAVEVGLSKTINAHTVYGGLGRKFLGDPPGVALKDIFYLYVGVERPLDENRFVGVGYDFAQATSSTAAEVSELTLYASQKLDGKKRLFGHVLLGLSDGSPDWGVGVGIAFLDW